MTSLSTRIIGALIFGFLLIFAFTVVMQLTADLINWLFNMQIRFLFPRGLINAFEDPAYFVSVLTSLIFSSLIAALIFFLVKLRRRDGIFEWTDENADQDD